MQCPSPITIIDKISKESAAVPCGKCGACMANKRADWSFRLKEEYRDSLKGDFLTLTYSEEKLKLSKSGVPELRKRDLELFMKRLRKQQSEKSNLKIRFYGVGEYGGKTERPHYHLLLFNCVLKAEKIQEIWGMGHIKLASINDACIHYVTKFHVSPNKGEFVDQETGEVADREDEFTTMSTRPGIGHGYIEKMKKWHRENEAYYVINNGYIQRMPEYYKDRIFTAEQRAHLKKDAENQAWENEEAEIERLKKLIPGLPYYYGSEIQKRLHQSAKRAEKKNKNDTGKF